MLLLEKLFEMMYKSSKSQVRVVQFYYSLQKKIIKNKIEIMVMEIDFKNHKKT